MSIDFQSSQIAATCSEYYVYTTTNLTSDLALRVISILDELKEKDFQGEIFCSRENCYNSTTTLKEAFGKKNIAVGQCISGGLGLHYFLKVGDMDPKLKLVLSEISSRSNSAEQQRY